MAAPSRETITLTTWGSVREALRSKDLRQAGYSEGAVVMAGTLLDLHGDEHRSRRRVENRLFRRETFAHWEHQVLGKTIESTLQPFVESGHGDLAQIGYHAAMALTAQIAGVDISKNGTTPADPERTAELYEIVKKFSEGATLMHSTRDKAEVSAEVIQAMDRFRHDFYQPSFERRQEWIEECDSGFLKLEQLPLDVLTTLLRNQDRLAMDADAMFREICFYLQAGAHSTANAFTHTVDGILSWRGTSAHDHAVVTDNIAFVQRCMHESLRLNPASPVAYRSPLRTLTLSDGTVLPEGSLVVLDLVAANSDEAIFGPTAASFDPYREMPAGVARWGLSFGAGTHACIGAELDGGLEIDPTRPDEQQLFGTVAVLADAFLRAGGRRDPANPAVLDPNSTRKHFSSYPVVFDAA